jgi:hypothetical protein
VYYFTIIVIGLYMCRGSLLCHSLLSTEITLTGRRIVIEGGRYIRKARGARFAAVNALCVLSLTSFDGRKDIAGRLNQRSANGNDRMCGGEDMVRAKVILGSAS